MAIALPGLASGLDSAALISSLMQIEAIPQNLIKNRISETQTMVSALQALNTRVASLGELAEKAAKPASLDLFRATSSSDKVTATAKTGATAGSIDIVVDQLAQRQVSVSGAVSVWNESSFTLTVAGVDTTITAASTSLDDVVSAVNSADAGVTATKVAVGGGLYRLQFSGAETGAANEFTVGTAALTKVSFAQDASVRLWAGVSGAEQVITSASNTFTDMLPGVDVTVSGKPTDPVNLSVARDSKATTKVAEDLVASVNSVLSLIAVNSSVSTSATGATKGGVFTGDSTARDVSRSILSAATSPIAGRSPSEIGVIITKDGKVEFNAEKFEKALADDPAFLQSTLQEIASRLDAAATNLSDKYDGQITSRIKGQESMIDRMSDQVIEWDRRIDTRRATLERTYSALEVQMSALNSQSAWLSSQLAALPKPNSNN
ncbi:flagellar filament capping protein FliD [Diaminobutyricimonas sp. TR449]|uniref:flagellar filament capping protein FliD n=1 Tax=Diaminobutyricimonas sp. TR449 TaxID=2708076 RepID=UPI0014218554|nr:flagellar filament capping protein FliD [Diaminobutyricimonas sp. TR449]